ncbi:MAG: DMT family transporter [Tissierellia bacterium]|nr:DMT family transporter [Tissierellia bacterium]
MKGLKNKNNMILAALFCMFLWGSAFPVLKLSYETLNIPAESYGPKLFYAGCRFFLAGILVLLYSLFRRRKIKIKKGDGSWIILIGFLQIFLQYLFFYIGVGNTTGIKSSIIQAGSSFFTVILAHFFITGDHLTMNKITALILGFSGIIIANWSKGFGGGFSFNGEGFLLISTLISSFAGILVKRKGDLDPFALTAGQMIIGSLFLLSTAMMTKNHNIIWTGKGIILLLYSGFLSATAFVLWYHLLLLHPIGELAVYRLFIPIFGALLSALFLPEERFTFQLLTGLILVSIASSRIYLPMKGAQKKGNQ